MSRVLFTGVYADRHGGLERFAERCAALLRSRGHEVDVVGDPSGAPGDYDFVLMHKSPRTLDVLRAMKRAYGEKLFFFAHDHELYCLRRHYYTPGRANCDRTYAPFPCRLCAAVTRPKWVLRALTRPIRAFVDEMAEVNAIAPSAYMKANLVKNGFRADRVAVLPPYFVDTDAPGFGRGHGTWMPDGRLRILFMGQLVAGKGCGLLVDAVRRLSVPHTLTIAGVGRDEARLRAMADADTVFLGWRDDAERLFDDADVCVFPSRWNEPFGLVGVEAFTHGVPVVAFDVGGVREWLDPGETGFLVAEQTPDALSAALARFADPALLARMGVAGVARIRERYAVGVFASRLEKIGGLR